MVMVLLITNAMPLAETARAAWSGHCNDIQCTSSKQSN